MSRRAILFMMLVVTVVAGAQDADYWVTERTLVIEPGMTLYGIVLSEYPEFAGAWEKVSDDLAAANPGLFAGGRALRPDDVLRLVDYGPRIDDTRRTATPAPVPSQQASPPSPPASTPPQATPPPIAASSQTAMPEAGPDDAASDPLTGQALSRIGVVSEASGEVIAIDVNNRQRTLAVTDSIFRGDAVLTEPGARAVLTMLDEGKIYLREDSRLVFENYTYYDNDNAGSAILTLLRGAFRAITGLLGKQDPEAVVINSPVATIGIRGTDFGLRICGDNDCVVADSGARLGGGLYSGVLDGQVALTNNTGEILTRKGEFFRISSPDATPVPAPEAAGLLFTPDELAALDIGRDEALGFWAWLKQRLFGD